MELGFEPIETSHWSRSATPLAPFPQLDKNLTTDVAVIGAGYTGLSAALHAAEGGASVILLEAEQPGWAASGRNAAQVCPFFYGATPAKIVKAHGEALGGRIASFIARSGDTVWDLIERHGIDCKPRRTGHLIVRRTEKSLAGEIETATQGRPYGLEFEVLSKQQLKQQVVSDRYAGGVRYLSGGLIQPLSFARGLAMAAERNGAAIFGNSAAISVARDGSQWIVRTSRGSVRANVVILGTGAYLDEDFMPELAGTYYPVTAAGLISHPLPDKGRSFLKFDGPIGDLDDEAVFSPALDPEGRLFMSIIVPRKERTLRKLVPIAERRLKKAFPQLKNVRWDRIWFGRFTVTPDHLPRVVRLADGMYGGIGDNGVGITLATNTGRELARLACGANEADLNLSVSAPKRAPLRSIMPGLMRNVLVPIANRVSA